jgi:hypothetical protein
MKPKILLLFTLFFQIESNAQKTMQSSLSFGTNNSIRRPVIDLLTMFWYTPHQIDKAYALNLTYKEDNGKKMYAGINLGYEHLIASNKSSSSAFYTFKVYTIKATGELYYKYYNKKSKFNLYGMFGLGLENNEIIKVDNSTKKNSGKVNLAWQITPIAFDFNIYKQLNGVMEFGFGYKGMYNIGLQYHIK